MPSAAPDPVRRTMSADSHGTSEERGLQRAILKNMALINALPFMTGGLASVMIAGGGEPAQAKMAAALSAATGMALLSYRIQPQASRRSELARGAAEPGRTGMGPADTSPPAGTAEAEGTRATEQRREIGTALMMLLTMPVMPVSVAFLLVMAMEGTLTAQQMAELATVRRSLMAGSMLLAGLVLMAICFYLGMLAARLRRHGKRTPEPTDET